MNAAVPRVHKAENENMAKPNHQYEEIGKERLQNNSDKENLYVNVVPTQSPAIVTVHSRSNDVNIAERNSEKTRHDIYKVSSFCTFLLRSNARYSFFIVPETTHGSSSEVFKDIAVSAGGLGFNFLTCHSVTIGSPPLKYYFGAV